MNVSASKKFLPSLSHPNACLLLEIIFLTTVQTTCVSITFFFIAEIKRDIFILHSHAMDSAGPHKHRRVWISISRRTFFVFSRVCECKRCGHHGDRAALPETKEELRLLTVSSSQTVMLLLCAATAASENAGNFS